MQLLIGQGNPGARYTNTRHNIGFMVMEAIATAYDFDAWRSRFHAKICEGKIDGCRVRLMKPETFYNETGRAAQAAAAFYKLPPEDIAVFHDEIDLAPGRLRIKRGGQHSGNRGIRSILSHLGPAVLRARMGIGHPGDRSHVTAYVLSDFTKSDIIWRDALIAACVKALPRLLTGDIERYQNDVMHLAPAQRHDPKQNAPPV